VALSLRPRIHNVGNGFLRRIGRKKRLPGFDLARISVLKYTKATATGVGRGEGARRDLSDHLAAAFEYNPLEIRESRS
jgi:hypothetical protein